MDELDRFDEPGGLGSHDLELVARLRTEPAPDGGTTARHHRQLVAAIQAAGVAGAAGVRPRRASIAAGDAPDRHDPDPDPDDGTIVAPFTPRSADEGRRGSRRRVLAVAAAVVVVAGGLAVATRLAPAGDDDRTVTGQSPVGEQQVCGPELPLAFPAPAGFEGPLPGPSGRVVQPEGPTDALMVHWRSGETTIDVRWPSSQAVDPTTPPPPGATTRTLIDSAPKGEGRHSVGEAFHTEALGTAGCNGLDVRVTAADAASTEGVLDQVEIGLLGPGGPLAPEQPLVTGSTTADTLPTLDEAGCGAPVGGPVEGSPVYPTPREALASFEATRYSGSTLSYEEVALADGSFAYVYNARPDLTTVVVHVVPSGEGWRVASHASTPC